MTDTVSRVQATLDNWRQQHADRLDPIRFQLIAALARRAESHAGAVRDHLDSRLNALLKDYADDLVGSTAQHHLAATSSASPPPPGTALADLIQHIASRRVGRDVPKAKAVSDLPPPAFPELEALDDFREIWSQVRTGSQLRLSLEQVPEDAGPLNSGALVHRAIALMHDLSPGYLQHFVAYADALSWLQEVDRPTTSSSKDTPRPAAAKSRPRSKPRGRRE